MPDNINSTSMLSVGTILKDTYSIDSYLSSGGFGNTYVPTNLTFNEKVAVKEFFLRGITQRDGASTVSVSNSENRALFDEQLEKFRKEAQRIRRLRSTHVVRVHDLFDANGTAYYVMDYIDGESLAARMRRTGQPLEEKEAMGYFGQVLDALEAIHAAGLCHMDLKPDNVMVDKADNAVLIDFGASKKIAGDQMTSTVTGVSYTNGYAPPEQLESDMNNFGPWTDIYALGATLYKLLTNRKPPMPSAIYSDPTPDKSRSLKFPESVSPQTRWLVTRMMTVAWHERPQSVADVRRMMAQAEQGTTDYQTQENTAIRNPALDYDDPTMVRNKPGTSNDGDYAYLHEGNQGDGSNSRKWLFALIGLLSLALLVGGLLFFNHNKKKEAAERAQFVSDSLANEKRLAQARLDSIEKARTDSIRRAEEARQKELQNIEGTYVSVKGKGIKGARTSYYVNDCYPPINQIIIKKIKGKLQLFAIGDWDQHDLEQKGHKEHLIGETYIAKEQRFEVYGGVPDNHFSGSLVFKNGQLTGTIEVYGVINDNYEFGTVETYPVAFNKVLSPPISE
jgi:serine/threonine protein kinase